MAIARTTSGNHIGGTSTTFAAGYSVGDLIVICQENTAALTLPSTPTGYTSLVTGQDSTNSLAMRVCWKIATSTSESTTPSNTTSITYAAYSGVNTTTPFTNVAGQSGATTTISYSGIATFANPGNDWVLTFATVKGITGNAGSVPPTAQTLVTEYKVTSDDNALFDSNAAVSSYSFNSKTLAAALPWLTKTAELQMATGGGGGGGSDPLELALLSVG